MLGLVALAAGEWLHRSEPGEKPQIAQGAYIPGVLTGVGILALFGAVYGSYELYGFLGSVTAFGLMGAVSAAGLLLGLRQGPAISGLGLAGSLITPLLVSTNEPSYPGLYAYLAIISAGAFGLARYRAWNWLSLATAGGALLWGAFGLYLHGPDELIVWLGYLAAVFALVVLAHVVNLLPFAPMEQTDHQARLVPPLTYGGVAVLLLGLLHVDETSLRALCMCLGFGLVGLGFGWAKTGLAPIACAAGALGLVASLARGAVLAGGIFNWPPGDFYIATPFEGAWLWHVGLSVGFGLVLIGASVSWLKRNAAVTGWPAILWAISGTLAPVLIMLGLWLLGSRGGVQWEFAALFALLVALYALGTEWLLRSEANDAPEGLLVTDWPVNLVALAAPVAAVFALVTGLYGLWLTLALADKRDPFRSAPRSSQRMTAP